ncbi:MAG: hypothetical protein VX620_15480 [Pseudomonadota bacterium]|nr:hypothetical protein [Pseudomonadota bacterium]RCK20076.1 hypothetical protein TH8_19615 [Thalassospira profundimaris]
MEAAFFETLFFDPFCSSSADYIPKVGDTTPDIRVIKSIGDQQSEIFGQPAVTTDIVIEVRGDDVAQPVKGGKFDIAGTLFEINAQPMRDITRNVWRCTCFEVV